ncbi:MAG: hypothetical protein ACM3JB_19960 [Acidobacteriaceae bacterium]
MKSLGRSALLLAFLAVLIFPTFAQQAQQPKKPGVLEMTELKQVVPNSFFFDGQVAPVQMRNCVAIRLNSGKLIEAGLVDNSGYSTGVAEKYQGFFITEQKITIGNKSLPPGQYGFGFANGKFRVMDVAVNDMLLVDYKEDNELKRPVPLKAVEEAGNYRLYAGKKYVTISVK